ncbi:hypothetical protein PG994_002500 [Apiospora phragmitis]|uniref:Uncharacterized protein n=1 Tax=Apiospora phragmitis TaxID=2905665 RepID=A0ABR1W953_9PEZI
MNIFTMNIPTMMLNGPSACDQIALDARNTEMPLEVIVSIIFGIVASLLALAGVIATLYQPKRPDAERTIHSEAFYVVDIEIKMLTQSNEDPPVFIGMQTIRFTRFESTGYLDGRVTSSPTTPWPQEDLEYGRELRRWNFGSNIH